MRSNPASPGPFSVLSKLRGYRNPMADPDYEHPEPQGYFPMAGFDEPEPVAQSSPVPLTASTSAVRLIVFMPIAQTLLVIVHVIGVRGTTTWIFLGFTMGVGAALSGVLAWADRTELEHRGFSRIPSPLWALPLPIVYLVLRAHAAEKNDWTAHRPVWVHAALFAALVAIGGLVMIFDTLFSDAYPV